MTKLDDISMPERFAVEIDFLREHPDHVAVSSQVLFIDPDGDLIGPMRKPFTHEEIEFSFFRGNSGAFIHAAMMVRHDILKAVGGYREKYRTAEDFDLFLRLMEHGRLANLPEFLYLYRQHLNSTCYTNRQAQQQLKFAILKEACERRKMPYRPEIIHTHHTPTSEAEIHRGWSITAMQAGNKKTAIKQSVTALRKQPVASSSWTTFFRVMAGRRVMAKLRKLAEPIRYQQHKVLGR